MKKALFIFCFAFLFTFGSVAQITVTQSNLPAVGHVLIMANDTIFAGITAGNTGANQTWNFANWINHTQDTMGFVNPSTLPGAGSFPTANIGVIDKDSLEEFGLTSSSAFDYLGGYGNILGSGKVAIKYNPYARIISLPSTYNTKFNGSYSFGLKFPYVQLPIDSIKFSVSISYSSNIDAWGTITTPTNANVPCLRQNYREITTTVMYYRTVLTPWALADSSTDTSTTYNWLSNTYNYTIASIQTDNAGNVYGANWLLVYKPGTIGISENPVVKNEIKVFPNPAHEKINFYGTSETSAIVIYDLNGKIVHGSVFNHINNTLDLSGYNNGMYIYEIRNTSGKILSKGRFIVEK